MSGTGSSSGTITATLTWTPDFDGDTQDPPSRFVYKENGGADAIGSSGSSPSVNVGFGDPVVTGGTFDQHAVSMLATVYDNHLLQRVITLPQRSLSASVTLGPGPGQFLARVSYVVHTYPPHEHPTNMRVLPPVFTSLQGQIGPDDGTLTFNMIWDSTSGKVYGEDLSDLASCSISEYVIYSGDGTTQKDPNTGTQYFRPLSPPFEALPSPGGYYNPTTSSGAPATDPPHMDIHDNGFGQPPSFVHPYVAAQFIGMQTYRFHCTICMDDGEYQNLMGPHPILRRVYQDTYGWWWFTISKLGYSSTVGLGFTP